MNAPPKPFAIGVSMAPSFARRGDSLADARAYEAAGCDSLWLEGDEDPWLAAAAFAVATVRARLVVPATEDDVANVALLGRRAATMQRLAPGRLAVCCAAGLLRPVLAALRCPVFCAVDRLPFAPDGAEGLLLPADAVLAADAAPLPGPPPGNGAIWLRIAVPADRAAWRQLLGRCRSSGATGAVVRETPRLLDLLRNPDQDDNRSDLALAQG